MRGLFSEYISSERNSNATCIITDKSNSRKQYIAYMLDRTSSMFEYDGLPDTIPAYMLELYLQVFGYAGFLDIEGSIQLDSTPHIRTQSGVHIFYGGIGGERDIYYRPKLFTVANPRLKNSIQATIIYPGDKYDGIKDPCVIMPCDTNMMGLLPLFDRYAQQLVENDISIRSAQINARALLGIATSTDRDRDSAKNFIEKLVAGEIAILGESNFLDSVSVSNVSTSSPNTIIQLIELQQYLKASWYNELGLNVNFNMKREYMSEEEIAVNTDILLPLVDDMLHCRERYLDLINKIFGLNISVRKASAWANKEQEDLAALSETSMKGNIPLKDTINDTIERDTQNAKSIQSDSQEVVSGAIGGEIQSQENGQIATGNSGQAQGLGVSGASGATGEGQESQSAGQGIDQLSGPASTEAIDIDINLAVGESNQIDATDNTAGSITDTPKDKGDSDDTE